MANRRVMLKSIEQFNEILVKAGYSYRQLAKEVECSPTQISLIANGERNPSPETAINICSVLKKSFDDIFFVKFVDKSQQK